jgi:hypothetical protein
MKTFGVVFMLSPRRANLDLGRLFKWKCPKSAADFARWTLDAVSTSRSRRFLTKVLGQFGVTFDLAKLAGFLALKWVIREPRTAFVCGCKTSFVGLPSS